MRRWKASALMAGCWLLVQPFWGNTALAAPLDPAKAAINLSSVSSEQDLVRRSDLIVHGRIGQETKSYPTGKRVGRFKVVHYVQTIQVQNKWKGSAGDSVRLLTAGLEPLPDAVNPLNKTYTGPLESGEYVCFLRRVDSSDYYSLTGLWQGLYPVYEGASVSLLANGGFPSFDKLPLRPFETKVKALTNP